VSGSGAAVRVVVRRPAPRPCRPPIGGVDLNPICSCRGRDLVHSDTRVESDISGTPCDRRHTSPDAQPVSGHAPDEGRRVTGARPRAPAGG